MKDVADLFGIGVGSIHRAIKYFELESKPNRWREPWNKGKTYKDDPRILVKESHPRYIDGRTYTSDFKESKKELLPDNCIACGNKATLIHHIDLNKDNNQKDNLIPFCASCHSIHHNKIRDSFTTLLIGQRKYWKEFKDRKVFNGKQVGKKK